MPRTDFSQNVINVLFVPTSVSYSLVAVDYAVLGLVNYLLFTAGGFRLNLLGNFKAWPGLSKLAFLVGPLVLLIGILVPVATVGWWALVPLIVYTAIAWPGGLALRRLC